MMVYVLEIQSRDQDYRAVGAYSTQALAESAFDNFLYDVSEEDLLFDTRVHRITGFVVDAVTAPA